VLNVFSSEIIKVYKILDAAAKSQVPIDLQDVFFRYTLDSFGRVGFRYAINSCENRAPFADAFDRMQRLITFRFYNPLWKITELLPSVRKQKKADLKTMNNLITAMLQERKAESEQERSKHSDLLTLFLNAKSETGESYSDEELIDHVKNFMIAGRDTTATALSWIVYNLCKHPVVLEKLMEEIQITTSESNELTYDVIKGMKYANAVFAESLRLYPSVPKNIKTCLNEIKLPSGVVIPAGAVAAHSAYAMGRCKTIWGETAEEFIPERWIDAAYTQFEYPVFNGGPRLCLGKTFAETQGVFALVSILKRYKIELTEPQKVNYTENILLVMRHGLKCQISVRE
jgi:cytochrome P450